METVRENLGSLEAAKKYNYQRIELNLKFGGCRSSAACLNCFHVIFNSICLCAGVGVCPNCGFDNSVKFNVSSTSFYDLGGFFNTNL